MVDVRKQSNFGDSNYQVSVKDLQDWEKRNGKIPKGAIMLLFTGNGEHYRNPQRYYGYKDQGELESRSIKLLKFPGVSVGSTFYSFGSTSNFLYRSE